MFAVVVTFQIRPEAMREFLPLMIENAQISLSEEPECHRFDVCTDGERPNEVLLYEIYSNRAAFDAHLESPHFKAFDRAVASYVLRKDVRGYATVVA